MSRSIFADYVLDRAKIQLSKLGYDLDDSLEHGDMLFGFGKFLAEGLRAEILFELKAAERTSSGFGFTIKLIRGKVPPLPSDEIWEYEGMLSSRLGHLLWWVYKIRDYEYPDHWWEPTNFEELEHSLEDALGKLEHYGIPWLEDLSSKSPGHISGRERDEFHEALAETIGPKLEKQGYVLILDKNVAKSFFKKQIDENLYSFIDFLLVRRPDMKEIEFHILLETNRSNNRYPQSIPTSEGFSIPMPILSSDLSRVMYAVYGMEEYKFGTLSWTYSNAKELKVCLADAAEKIVRYAIPWLEDPESENLL